MCGREVLKAVMEHQDITNAILAKRLNITSAAVWERLNNKNVKDIPVSLLSEMLQALNYKVIVVPEDTELPEGGYQID